MLAYNVCRNDTVYFLSTAVDQTHEHGSTAVRQSVCVEDGIGKMVIRDPRLKTVKLSVQPQP